MSLAIFERKWQMRGIRVLSDILFQDVEANRLLLSVSIQVTSPLNGSLKLRSSS